MTHFAHVDVRRRALRCLVTDGAEEVKTRWNDSRRLPELALCHLEDGLAGVTAARGKVPPRRVGFADPDGELAIERDDHRELRRRGRVLPEGVVSPRYEREFGHFVA